MKGIDITIRKFKALKKCGLCGRVREIFYKLSISDYKKMEVLAGELDLCKECGDNLNKILGNENEANEITEKEFIF